MIRIVDTLTVESMIEHVDGVMTTVMKHDNPLLGLTIITLLEGARGIKVGQRYRSTLEQLEEGEE